MGPTQRIMNVWNQSIQSRLCDQGGKKKRFGILFLSVMKEKYVLYDHMAMAKTHWGHAFKTIWKEIAKFTQ